MSKPRVVVREGWGWVVSFGTLIFGDGTGEDTYEVSVEGQADDVGGEEDAHDVDFGVFQGHPEAVEGAHVFGVDVGDSHVFRHAQLGHFEFFLGEAPGVVGEVGQDEGGQDGDEHCCCAFDWEGGLVFGF